MKYLSPTEMEEQIGKKKVAQPLKASPGKLNNCPDSSPDHLSTTPDQHPLGDQLKKAKEKQLAGFSPVKKERRGEDEEGEEKRTWEKDTFENQVEDKMKGKVEDIKEHGFMIRIEYENFNCKGSGKHKMPFGTGRIQDKDYKCAKVERELEKRISDDPAEFEEPELYESMRLLREVGGCKVEEEGGRKRRKGGHEGGANANADAKRPTLNLEKMLKV